MASRLVLFLAVAAVACLPAPASAVDWMVGDYDGWRAKFNTTGWADGKTFRVGDTLSKKHLLPLLLTYIYLYQFSHTQIVAYIYVCICMHICIYTYVW
jgi:hypothetical protein